MICGEITYRFYSREIDAAHNQTNQTFLDVGQIRGSSRNIFLVFSVLGRFIAVPLALVYLLDGVRRCTVLLDAAQLHELIDESVELTATAIDVMQVFPEIDLEVVFQHFQEAALAVFGKVVVSARVMALIIGNTDSQFPFLLTRWHDPIGMLCC